MRVAGRCTAGMAKTTCPTSDIWTDVDDSCVFGGLAFDRPRLVALRRRIKLAWLPKSRFETAGADRMERRHSAERLQGRLRQRSADHRQALCDLRQRAFRGLKLA